MSYSISADTITLGPMTIDKEPSERPKHKFPGTDIRITPANGGYIVSVGHTSRGFSMPGDPELYIVSEEQDLGTEIGKIITMSNLKRDHE